MKKLITLLFLLTGTLLSSIEPIDERVTDIYFSNGMLTSKYEARDALKYIIKPTIKAEIYHGDKAEMDRLHNFKLAYNSTFKGKEIASVKLDEVSGGILDIMESYEQLKNTSLGWKLFSNVKDIVVEITLKKATLTAAVRKKIYDYLAVSSTKTRDGIIQAIQEGIKHQKDADSQWQKAKGIGCPGSCDHRIEVAHRYDPALDISMSGVSVLPFDGYVTLEV